MAQSGKSDELTTTQQRAIAALLSERDIRAAAKKAGVGERTLHRWLDDPAFQAELKTAETRAIDAAIRRLAELSGLAVDTLSAAMNDEQTPPATKIRAAEVVLTKRPLLKELYDLEARIAALESRLNDGQL